MGRLDLVLRSTRVVTPEGLRPASVGIAEGRIAVVADEDAGLDARHVENLGDDALLPGLVDTHVHVNEPGRTEWEGFETATRAAAAGGVTTIVDMPLNSIPPTTDVEALEVKRRAAEGRCHVDVGFWGGLVPANADRIHELAEAGVFGVKCFLSPSGVEEFPHCSSADLARGLDKLAPLGLPVAVHAEDPDELAAVGPAGPVRRYERFLASRPPEAETVAVARLAALAAQTGCRVHVVHICAADAAATVADARRRGIGLSAETCPHYLDLCAEEVPEGATEFKCCPPVRPAINRERLWQQLASGAITSIVSDHSPCLPDLKLREAGDFANAWGGIASLQLGLSVVWTRAQARGHDLTDLAGWMAAGPARLIGLRGKGFITPGYDADLVRLAPEETFVVDPASLLHRHPVSPYAGRTLSGVVRATWLRGVAVDGSYPRGLLLRATP